MTTRLPKLRRPEPFEVGQLPGVSGVVLSDYSAWNGLVFMVGGRHIKPRGLRRRVMLPAKPRPVEARLRGGRLFPGAEKLLVDGQAYSVGPAAPVGLRALTMLPAITLLLVKPIWGWPGAWLAVYLNILVLRSSHRQRAKVALMVAGTGAAAAVNLALAAAFGPAFPS